jgi:uncharacterized protein (DUF305 family)
VTAADAPPQGDQSRSTGPAVWQVVVLVVALCFVAGIVGYWIGQPDEGESFSSVDVGFLADMSAHHNSAIGMSFDQLGHGADPTVQHFARDIALSQTQEITVMNALLDESGNRTATADDVAMDWMGMATTEAEMPGMPTDAQVRELAAAEGVDADDLFTTLMIRHHAGGAAMAEYAAAHGENSRVRRIARSMAKVQRREIAEMNARRSALGLPRVDVSDVMKEMDSAGSHPH